VTPSADKKTRLPPRLGRVILIRFNPASGQLLLEFTENGPLLSFELGRFMEPLICPLTHATFLLSRLSLLTLVIRVMPAFPKAFNLTLSFGVYFPARPLAQLGVGPSS